MNEKEDSMEMLDWDKKNIIRFAQYLYDLAKERVQLDNVISPEAILKAPIESEVVEEVLEEPDVEIEEEVLEEPDVEIEEEVLEEPDVEIEEEVLEEPDVEIEEEVLEEPDVEIVEEVLEEPDEDAIQLDKELQEVTIGLAKAVSGEEVGEIDSRDKEEIQEIIEKEHIPLPVESKELEVEESIIAETEPSEVPEQKVTQEALDQDIGEFEAVDLSEPIVKEPIINQEILIQPENIPKDIHNMVFVEEATSVPITKDEIIIKTTEVTEDSSRSVVEKADLEITTEMEEVIGESGLDETIDAVTEEPLAEEAVIEEVVPETKVEASEKIEGLDEEAVQRRQNIIEQMLADTKQREQEEGFKVRELGETAGRSYSAVVFGNESTKNVKKWKKWEKRRLRQVRKKKEK